MRTILLGGLAHLIVGALLVAADDYRLYTIAPPAALAAAAALFVAAGWRMSDTARSRLELAGRCFGVVALGWFLALSMLLIVDELKLHRRLGIIQGLDTKCWYCPPWWERLAGVGIASVVLGLFAAALSPVFWAVRRRFVQQRGTGRGATTTAQ
jgi:hypothetical protein